MHRGLPGACDLVPTCAPYHYYTADCFARAAANKISLVLHRRSLNNWPLLEDEDATSFFHFPDLIQRFGGALEAMTLFSSKSDKLRTVII